SESPRTLLADLGVEIPDHPTPLSIVSSLRRWAGPQAEKPEYGSLAESAAADAVGTWYAQKGEQGSLFAAHDDAFDVWRKAANGSGFCELSRLFFARFTGRYLNYFLERQASA